MSDVELVGTTQLKLRDEATFDLNGWEFVAVTPRMALDWVKDNMPVDEQLQMAIRFEGGQYTYGDLIDILRMRTGVTP